MATEHLTEEERERALAYFDPAWYGAAHELDGLNTEALETRFLEVGIWEGHDPGPWFRSDMYQAAAGIAAERTGLPPFVHYIRKGCLERRKPTPLFLPFVYAYFLTEDADRIPDLYAHFIRSVGDGNTPRFNPIIPADWTEAIPDIPSREAYSRLFDPEATLVGLLPKCCFRPIFYRQHASVLTWENELVDYVLEGWRKGYDPHPLFDSAFYMDLLEKHDTLDHNDFNGLTPLEHFIEHWSDAPAASPFFDAPYYNHIANLPETSYANPFEAFCAMDERFLTVSPHRKVNFEALGHAWNDSVIGGGQPFTANHFMTLVTKIRLGKCKRPEQTDGTPEVSILSLNYKNPEHTILSAYCALMNLGGHQAEILVMDNGSGNWDLHQIERYLSPFTEVRVFKSETNLYFGEGNNLLIDAARGKYLLFLNNDAYLGATTIDDMVSILDSTPDCALVGPTFLFPDGKIQEEGGIAPDCGNTIQRSKHLPADEFILRRPPETHVTEVDYISAAIAMVRAEQIEAIGGFDFVFEPLFFEDTDLCRRLRAHGHKVLVSHRSFAVHIENTSTSELLADKFVAQINTNRRRYADRWLRRPSDDIPRAGANLSRFKAHAGGKKPKALVYTPFRLSVGGGERYLLSIASSLSADYDVTVATPWPTSRTRLAFVMQDLGLEGSFALTTMCEVDPRETPDLFIAMGNEILPTVPAMGRRNIYHCQFPFPLHRVQGRQDNALDGYESIVVNSDFTASHVKKALQDRRLPDMPVHVIHPPVKVNKDEKLALARFEDEDHPLTVATLGRYITREHMKRQDVVLDTLVALGRGNRQIKGIISGSLSTDEADMAYFGRLRNSAPLGVTVECNVSAARVADNLTTADIYMHATGFGMSPALQPHYMEHFGISIVEAMSYGCVPLVFDGGGAAELVMKAGVGATFRSRNAAEDEIIAYSKLPVAQKKDMALQAFKAAQAYDEALFRDAWRSLIKG
ncbi:glycosyltransferase [Kordiimonas marina]|uniref:glycosyltransferase n=1 Tax=Kordiimonas marina TaxID=2872312 RepID=UPI001FF363B2|nr:glycosyltransferase [Kordiimonas marina]MCJ9429762.1 glycosyltransferase [Kordiimonas marina]